MHTINAQTSYALFKGFVFVRYCVIISQHLYCSYSFIQTQMHVSVMTYRLTEFNYYLKENSISCKPLSWE